MPSNTAASMFGGAGGRGSRVSVASLEGLRNVLRNDAERDAAPAAAAAAAAPPAPVKKAAAPPAAPADDKQTLRDLNDRLHGYVGRVKAREEENQRLQEQIDEILAKRKTPDQRDWAAVEKPLDDLKDKIKNIAQENAKLLLDIDNTKLAEDDLKNKLEDEERARRAIEKDLEDLKRNTEDTKLSRKQTQDEIDMVKEELARLDQDHKDEVAVLRQKVRDSEVNVEIASQNSNLAEVINKIRSQYDTLAQKNLRETEEWYQSKFENIKVVEAQKCEDLQTGKSELKELLKQKQILDIKIQTVYSMLHNLEETLKMTKVENGQRLAPLNKIILSQEAELKEVRAQVERQVNVNKDLLCVKMKLEAEINNYQQLMIPLESDSSGLSLEDPRRSDQQKPKVANQQKAVKEKAPVEKKDAPSDKSAPPKDPKAEEELIQPDSATKEAAPVQPSGMEEKKKKKKKKSKTKEGSSSSSSSSSSSPSSSSSSSSSDESDNDKKPKKEAEEAKA